MRPWEWAPGLAGLDSERRLCFLWALAEASLKWGTWGPGLDLTRVSGSTDSCGLFATCPWGRCVLPTSTQPVDSRAGFTIQACCISESIFFQPHFVASLTKRRQRENRGGGQAKGPHPLRPHAPLLSHSGLSRPSSPLPLSEVQRLPTCSPEGIMQSPGPGAVRGSRTWGLWTELDLISWGVLAPMRPP